MLKPLASPPTLRTRLRRAISHHSSGLRDGPDEFVDDILSIVADDLEDYSDQWRVCHWRSLINWLRKQ